MTYTVVLLTADDDYARGRAASDQLSGRQIIPQIKSWICPCEAGLRNS
jgi:hypothetical protein